ncbi:MAG: multiheme c-type cytochrome [Sandaracinus sp.]
MRTLVLIARTLVCLLVLAPLAACARPDEPLPFGARSQDCATCHVDQAEAFSGSAHARSDASPVLAALIPRATARWGAAAGNFCARCHTPSHAAMTGDPDAEVTITCVTCHAAIGNRGERDGLLLVDPSAPLGGPFDDPEPTPAHASRAAPLVSSSSLCGTCHEVTGPSVFVEATLSEHRVSVSDPSDPSCASCHLPRLEDGPIALGAEASRQRRDHRFVGIDPPWGASAEQRTDAARESAALVARALALELTVGDGEALVRVTNVGARHAVPTGVSFLRDVWIDVELVAADGASEHLPRVITLGDQPMRAGEPVALITDADAVERHRLDAGQSAEVRVEVPPGAHVIATLRARAFRADVLDALELGSRADEVPVLEVARLEE